MASRARRTNNTTQQPARRTSTRIHPPPQQQQEPAASSTSNKTTTTKTTKTIEDDREQVEGTSADSDNSSVESHPPRRQGKHFLSPSSRGLSFNVQRQLITDIVLNGGLELVRLRDLCNSKPDVYGLQRSKVRRKIQNKVNEWKRLSPSAYIQLLNQLNISISSHQHLSGLINDNKVRRVMIVV
jgi:hypothetical protein